MPTIKIPIEIGTKVYMTTPNFFGDITIIETEIVKTVQEKENNKIKHFFSTNFSEILISEEAINKTVFLTKEEAEEKIHKLNN